MNIDKQWIETVAAELKDLENLWRDPEVVMTYQDLARAVLEAVVPLVVAAELEQVGWYRDGKLKASADMLIREGIGVPKTGPEGFGWEPVFVRHTSGEEPR